MRSTISIKNKKWVSEDWDDRRRFGRPENEADRERLQRALAGEYAAGKITTAQYESATEQVRNKHTRAQLNAIMEYVTTGATVLEAIGTALSGVADVRGLGDNDEEGEQGGGNGNEPGQEGEGDEQEGDDFGGEYADDNNNEERDQGGGNGNEPTERREEGRTRRR